MIGVSEAIDCERRLETKAKGNTIVELLWHYTVGNDLRAILLAGEIRPTARVSSKGEKPAVWFSTNQDWDPSANRNWRSADGTRTALSKEQTHELAGGLCRVGIAPSPALIDWQTYKSRSGVSLKVARAIYQAALAKGVKPSEWFASFEPVPREKWVAVEAWNGQEWRSVPPEEIRRSQRAEV